MSNIKNELMIVFTAAALWTSGFFFGEMNHCRADITNPPTLAGKNIWKGENQFTPANKSITLSPTGTGTVTINPATAGTLNNVTIGGATPGAGTFSALTNNGNSTLTGTAAIGGNLAVGGTVNPSKKVFVSGTTTTGATQIGIDSSATADSLATSGYEAYRAFPATAAAAFTVTDVSGVKVYNANKGSGSTITNLHGVYISDLTQGTNNYGVTSQLTASSNKWNIYASGTANNYFAGNAYIGTATPKSTYSSGGVPSLAVEKAATYSATANYAYTTSASGGAMLILGRSKNAALGTLSETIANDALGYISFEGVNASSALVSGAWIKVIQTGAASAGFIPAAYTFFASDGTAAPLERLRVDSSALTVAAKIKTAGTAPTITEGAADCGTSPSVVGTDTAGRVTVGSGANGGKCTVNFSSAYTTNAPICIVQNETTANLVRPANVTTAKVEITGTLLAGDSLVYNCIGR